MNTLKQHTGLMSLVSFIISFFLFFFGSQIVDLYILKGIFQVNNRDVTLFVNTVVSLIAIIFFILSIVGAMKVFRSGNGKNGKFVLITLGVIILAVLLVIVMFGAAHSS